MTTENSQPEHPSEPEASSAPATPADLPGEAPKLNREQRRAQSKGKATTTSGFHASNAAKKSFGGGRPANAPIQNKIPRTGHK